MKAYKGFDKDLKCKGFQYEVGKEYEEPEVILCDKGFHACLAPIDVFRYYAPAISRYCEVEIDGEIKKATDDSKIAGTKIKIIREISLDELIEAQTEQEEGKDAKKVVTTRDFDVATAGDRSVAAANDWSTAVAGLCSVAAAKDCGVAKTGDYGVATTRHFGAAIAGNGGIATAGNSGAATVGECGVAVSRGSASTREQGICVARGNGCRVKGGLGSVLVLVEECKESYKIENCKMAVVDGKKIKADTWYTLRNDEFFEVKEED